MTNPIKSDKPKAVDLAGLKLAPPSGPNLDANKSRKSTDFLEQLQQISQPAREAPKSLSTREAGQSLRSALAQKESPRAPVAQPNRTMAPAIQPNRNINDERKSEAPRAPASPPARKSALEPKTQLNQRSLPAEGPSTAPALKQQAASSAPATPASRPSTPSSLSPGAGSPAPAAESKPAQASHSTKNPGLSDLENPLAAGRGLSKEEAEAAAGFPLAQSAQIALDPLAAATLANILADPQLVGAMPQPLPLGSMLASADKNLEFNSQPELLALMGAPLAAAPTMAGPEDLQLLQSLTFMLGGNEKLFEASPTLAFLSGHLESLNPTTIPALVSESPLLQKILGSQTPQDWMNELTSLQNILSEMGLDQSPLAKIVSQKGIGEHIGSLQDVLKALGLDPQRILREGELLQQTVPLDGVQPYMLRAAKLRAQKPQGEIDLLAGATQGMPSLLLASQLQHLTPPPHSESAPLMSPPLQSGIPAKLIPPTIDPSSLPVQGMELLPIEAEMKAMAAEGMPLPLEFKPVSVEATRIPLASPLPEELALPQMFSLSSSSLGDRPLVREVAENPFSNLPLRWANEDIQTITFASPAQPAAEMLEFQAQTDALFGPSQALGFETLAFEGSPLPSSATSSTTQNLTEMISALALSEGSLGNSEDFMGEGREQGSSGFAENSQNSMLGTAAPKVQNSGVFQLQNPTTNAPVSVPREIVQQVFDNASMMLKEGGGSIRVDLGSEALGTLDLALDIKDNSVEIRIIASSSQVREMLNQDLPRLRESLLSQNLNLEKVEIGLGGNSAWSQSSGDGRSSRGQSQESFEQGSYRGPGGRTTEVRSYRQVTGQRQNEAWHPGSIQVRV